MWFVWELSTPGIATADFVETAIWAKWKWQVSAKTNLAKILCHKTALWESTTVEICQNKMDFSVGKIIQQFIFDNEDNLITGDEYVEWKFLL